MKVVPVCLVTVCGTGRLRDNPMKYNFEEVVGVEEALDHDAVTVSPVLDAAIV